MFFKGLTLLSTFINNQGYDSHNHFLYNYQFKESQNQINLINNIKTNNIGIIDFRYILKKSNAMNLLGNKFLSLEKEINEKIKQKQIYFKNKEERIKKSRKEISEIEYKRKIKLFKEEVFQNQKKYKEERSLLNKSFQKIQKDIKDLLAQIIKDISIKKKY